SGWRCAEFICQFARLATIIVGGNTRFGKLCDQRQCNTGEGIIAGDAAHDMPSTFAQPGHNARCYKRGFAATRRAQYENHPICLSPPDNFECFSLTPKEDRCVRFSKRVQASVGNTTKFWFGWHWRSVWPIAQIAQVGDQLSFKQRFEVGMGIKRVYPG